MPADQPVQIPTPKPGDFIWVGRFRNRPAIVTRVFMDDKGVAKYEFEAVPKGRKKTKVRNLLPYRAMNSEDSAKYKKLYDEETLKIRERKKQALKVAARFHRAYVSELWPKAVAAIQRYELLYQDAMALKDPLTEEGRAVLAKFDLNNVDAWPRFPKNDFGAWVEQCYQGPLSGYLAMAPYGVLNGKASLADYQAALRKEHEAIQAILDSVGPERFTYKGFKIYNPERMTDSLCLLVLEAVDYVVALFKKRGVSLELLRQGLAAVYIEPRVTSMAGKHAAGTYLWGVIELSATALKGSGGLLERFMNEVFLHEFGHHVHEHVLPKEAKRAWDAPWDAYDEVQEEVKTVYMQTSAQERQRWFALLEKTKFDVSKAAARLKGLEKLKFGAWLRQDMWKNPLIKPKRFQLTERGEAVFDLLRKFQEDPEKAARDEFRGVSYSPEELKQRGQEVVETYKGWLGIGPHWMQKVDLDPVLVQQLADSDPAMDAALTKAKIELGVLKSNLVSDYAKTNKQEDFAETFVAFMGAPQKLTPETKFRMQRTLSLAGLYGKPVMRLAATIDKSSVDKWKKDLKAMTKIYRDLELPRPDDYSPDRSGWDEARLLFKQFRDNLEEWTYKVLLPRPNSDRLESPLEKSIRSLVWDLRFKLDPHTLFPGRDNVPDWGALRHERDKNIKRYQASATKAFNEIEIYLGSRPGEKVERRDAVDHFLVGGVQVVVKNFGRDSWDREEDLDGFLRKLKHSVDRITRAGFARAVKGLTVTVDFDPRHDEGLTAGTYQPDSDTLRMLPLGIVGQDKGHGTFTHECGHRFYYKSLPGPARTHWEEVMESRGVKITPADVDRFADLVTSGVDHSRIFDKEERLKATIPRAKDEAEAAKFTEMATLPPKAFDAVFDAQVYRDKLKDFYEGEVVQLEEITEYANTNASEAFAECFREWVLKGPRALGPWTRQFFTETCRAGGARLANEVMGSENNNLLVLKVAVRHQRAAEVTLADVQNIADEFGVGINLPAEGQAFSWDDNDSLADELLDDDSSLTPDTLPAVKVAARYQEKKKVPKANGKGTTEVYVYSPRQVQKRNKDKAERLQKFKPKVEKLRSKIKSDLGSEDRETRLIALAIGLIDETHERVGNEESAKGNRNDSGEPHYGVTGWKKSHITLGSSSATIKYVGKSGVKQEKTVSTPHILKALRRAYKEAEGKDSCIFDGDDGSVTAEQINEYLEPFEVSAKDLRGLAANSLCQKALKRVRAKGGKLPEDKKEREAKLKSEFKEAIEEVSEELGHEASTLANQYLAPNMRSEYEKDGTVIDKLSA